MTTNNQEILVLDYVNNKVLIYSSVQEVSNNTNIKPEVIKARLKKDPYIAGYEFFLLSDIDHHHPPLFKGEYKLSAPKDREIYTHKCTATPTEVEIMDIDQQTITTYPSINYILSLNLFSDYPTAFKANVVDFNKPLFIYDNRYIVKLKTDTRKWEDAIPFTSTRCKTALVKDIVTNEIKRYRSLKEACAALPEVNYVTVKATTRVNQDKPLRIMYERYIFKHETDQRSFDDAVTNIHEGVLPGNARKVQRMHLDTSTIEYFDTLSSASKETGIHMTTLFNAIKSGKPIKVICTNTQTKYT